MNSMIHILVALVVASGVQGRQLSFEQIAGFEPSTSVTDHNAIDLDQNAIETQVNLQTLDSFNAAARIYKEGGYSKSYAELVVNSSLSIFFSVFADDLVSGTDASGRTVYGIVLEDTTIKGTGSTFKFQYKTSQDQATYVNCQVGGLPDPNLDGCLAATGTIRLDGSTTDMSYTYDPATDNKNARTIQYFSTSANTRMRKNTEETGSFYEDFQKFVDYYGDALYADKFISGALAGESVTLGATSWDFSQHDFEARAEAVKKGSAYMAIFMYVIRELEDGLDDCEKGCDTDDCNDDAVHALDEAVAFYTGSLEGTDGTGSGLLMYSLANKRCENFKTCGTDGRELKGTSKVNIDVFTQFKLMQQQFRNKDCEAARLTKELAVNKMIVPLIQGTLRYAWKLEYEADVTQKDESEGATFAAAVLPWINSCNKDHAQTIYNNMQIGQEQPVKFADVKKAFESTYDCLGITCADVGGLWGIDTYAEGATPCGGAGSGAYTSRIQVGLTFAAAFIAMFTLM